MTLGMGRIGALKPSGGKKEGMQYPALVPKMGAVGGGARQWKISAFQSSGQIALLPVYVSNFCLAKGQEETRAFSKKGAVPLWDLYSLSGTLGSVLLTDLVFRTAFALRVGVPPLVHTASAPAKWLPWRD